MMTAMVTMATTQPYILPSQTPCVDGECGSDRAARHQVLVFQGNFLAERHADNRRDCPGKEERGDCLGKRGSVIGKDISSMIQLELKGISAQTSNHHSKGDGRAHSGEWLRSQ